MLFPEIDENIPLPANAVEALPDLSPQEELNARVRTIKFISDITGTPIVPNKDDVEGAKQLATQMMSDPAKRIEYSKYPNEMMAYLAGMVAQTNCALVDDLSELKMYVINKLVYEIEHAKDSRVRVQAVTKLGEVDGIDAFKKRTETTHIIKPIEEVEKELMSVLEGIEYRVIGEKDDAANA